MITGAYKEECMSQARVFERHERLDEGRQNMEDDECSWWPSISRIKENVHNQIVRENRQLNVQIITEGVNIGKDTT